MSPSPTRPTSTRVRRALDHRFRITTPDARLTGHLDGLLASLPPDDGTAGRAGADRVHDYAIEGPDAGGRWLATLDGEAIDGPASQTRAVALVLWCLNRSVVSSPTDTVVLHAGGVVVDGSALLLPGVMEAGKSTLVAGLLRTGADYLSDEAIAVDHERGTVAGYAKPVSLDPGSWPLFADLEPVLDADLRRWSPAQWQLPPARFGARAVAEVAARWVVFPRYEPGAPTRLAPLAGSEALLRAIGCVFPTALSSAEVLRGVAALLDPLPCMALTSGSLDEAVTVLRRWLAEGSAPASSTAEPDQSLDPEAPLDDPEEVALPRAFVPTSRIRPLTGVTAVAVHGESVLHDSRNDELLGLNATGGAAWSAIETGSTVEVIVQHVVGVSGGGYDAVLEAVHAFLADLHRRGLLEVETEDG